MATGTAAIIVAIIAAIPGGLAYWSSRHNSDTDASLRSDDAAWTRLQATVLGQSSELDHLRSDFVLLQHKFQEAVTHGERCDAALEVERKRSDALHAQVTDLRRRLDEGDRP